MFHFRIKHFAFGENKEVRLPVEEVVTVADEEDSIPDGVGDVEATSLKQIQDSLKQFNHFILTRLELWITILLVSNRCLTKFE